MNQNDAPAYTIAALGHPSARRAIVKTSFDRWRYVDSGNLVDDEDFRAGWDDLVDDPNKKTVLLKGEPSGLTSEQLLKLECLDRAKRDVTGRVDGRVFRTQQDDIVELAEIYIRLALS